MAVTRKNSLSSLLGFGAYAGFSFLTSVAVGRVLGPDPLGVMALAVAVSNPPTDLALFHLRAVQTSDANNEWEFSTLLGFRLLAQAVAFAVLCVYALVRRDPPDLPWAVLWFAARCVFENVSDLHYGMLQRIGRMDLVGRLMALKSGGAFAAFLGVLLLFRSLPAAMAAAAVWTAITLALFDRPLAVRLALAADHPVTRRGMNPTLERARLAALFVLALPLAIAIFLNTLNAQIGRLVLDRFVGEAALGQYAAYLQPAVAARILVVALGVVAAAPYAEAVHRGDRPTAVRLTVRIVGLSVALAVVLPLVGLAIGGPLIGALFGSRFERDPVLFAYVLVGAGTSFVVSGIGYALTAFRAFREQPWIYGAAIVGFLLPALVLIPRRGLWGAVDATILGNLVAIVWSGAIVFRRLQRVGREP